MNFRREKERESEFFTIREEIFHFTKLEPQLDIDGALDRKNVGLIIFVRLTGDFFFAAITVDNKNVPVRKIDTDQRCSDASDLYRTSANITFEKLNVRVYVRQECVGGGSVHKVIKYLYRVSAIRECVYVGHILLNISPRRRDEYDVCIRNSDFHKETGDVR